MEREITDRTKLGSASILRPLYTLRIGCESGMELEIFLITTFSWKSENMEKKLEEPKLMHHDSLKIVGTLNATSAKFLTF